jgi:hypothetical protein
MNTAPEKKNRLGKNNHYDFTEGHGKIQRSINAQYKENSGNNSRQSFRL